MSDDWWMTSDWGDDWWMTGGGGDGSRGGLGDEVTVGPVVGSGLDDCFGTTLALG